MTAELKGIHAKTFQDLDVIKDVLKLDEEKIADLEKENAELKADNDARKFAMAMSEKVEKQLRDENAELKKDNSEWEKASDKWKSVYELTNNQLTKAKEIIKKLSKFVNNEVEYDPEHPQEHTNLWNELCEQAEQFLNENSTYERIQKAKYNYTD